MNPNEFSSEGYAETDTSNGVGEPPRSIDWPGVCMKVLAGFSVVMFVVAVFLPHPSQRRLINAEIENASLLSRNQELGAENRRLESQHSSMRSRLLGARIRVHDLELYIDEQKRIHEPQPEPIPNGETL